MNKFIINFVYNIFYLVNLCVYKLKKINLNNFYNKVIMNEKNCNQITSVLLSLEQID